MDGVNNRWSDERFMRRALALARKGEGTVSPNPLVGAVIVRNGKIIGEGFHRCCGENHAEINALRNATEDVAGATFYITLEPCSHHGRTPPCVDSLISCRPGRVVIGAVDPNPLVSGKGIAALRQSGIPTEVGVLDAACREINRFFFKFIRTGLPYVTLKFAQTLDGRIATVTGDARWVSSPSAVVAAGVPGAASSTSRQSRTAAGRSPSLLAKRSAAFSASSGLARCAAQASR